MASADNNDNSNDINDMNGIHNSFDDNGIYNYHKDGNNNCHSNGTDCPLRSQNIAS